jgi:AAA family ATP:ADP antiporter
MAAYGIVRPLANAVFLEHFSPSDMLLGMAMTPVVVTVILWPYGWLLSRTGPLRTMLISTALSLALLLLPLVFRHPVTAFFLYVWKDAFVVLLVEQFWAHANSVNSIGRAKKIYGMLLLVGGTGAVSGNKLVSLLAEPVGTWTVYSFGPLLLLPFAVAMIFSYRWLGQSGKLPVRNNGHAGLGVLRQSPYLSGIAVMVGLGQVMAAALDVLFHMYVARNIGGLDSRAAFEGDFWFYVNLGSMVAQAATPFILHGLSVRILHLLIPVTHLGLLASIVFFPGLHTAAAAFAWFKILDYSLFRACKEVLYVPLDFDARYRAKMVIDMVIYRTTKGGAALGLSLLEHALATLISPLLAVIAAGAAVWAVFGWKTGQKFATMETETERHPPTENGGT